jgi:hypothetical protein
LSPTFDHRNPEMAIVVQKIAIAFIVSNEVNVNETRRADTRMTSAEYDGDNPLRLANEIDAALAKYGLGNDHRMCNAIHFFEGELRLIAECLRCAGPQKVAKQRPGSTRPASTSKASLPGAAAA